MSTPYEIAIDMRKVPIHLGEELIVIANNLWSWLNWREVQAPTQDSGVRWFLHASSKGQLPDDVTPQQFANKVRDAIWEKAQQHILLVITTTCLQDLPHVHYDYEEEEDYEVWNKENKQCEK